MKSYCKEKKLKQMLSKIQEKSKKKRLKKGILKDDIIKDDKKSDNELVNKTNYEKQNYKNETNTVQYEDNMEKNSPTKEKASDTGVLLTSHLFSSLPLCPQNQQALKELNFQQMTEIQHRSIPHLLEHKDLMASAKTGSGKTLAFLIPVLELMLKLGFQPRNGTGAIIISPTRELSLQTFGVLKSLTQHMQLRVGLVIGGTNRAEEVRNLNKGVTVLVSTPGRLLDHLQNTEHFLRHNLKILVIDEADRCLDCGFEEEMKQILRLIPKQRQTMLFSATFSRATHDLAQMALKADAVRIGIDDKVEQATVETLEQGYLVCPPDKRFTLLFNFLKKNKNKKTMVFMASCMEVKFYYELLNFIDFPVLAIHGKQKQVKRTSTFFRFGQLENGVLLCTDVAARGLDIPQVDWIFQYDPPDDPKEYIHRVGRTARAGAHGQALLLLRPHELDFLSMLKKARVKVTEFEVNKAKLECGQQEVLEQIISENTYLSQSAEEAFKGLVRSYSAHSLPCFAIRQLDFAALAKTFGLSKPPLSDLNLKKKITGKEKLKKKKKDKS